MIAGRLRPSSHVTIRGAGPTRAASSCRVEDTMGGFQSSRHKVNSITQSTRHRLNPLLPTSNCTARYYYTAVVIGTLAVDGWAVTFGTAKRGLGGLGPRPVPSSLYQM